MSSTSTPQTSSQKLSIPSKQETKRILGSQENLMLPRQYQPHLTKNPKNNPFPQMNHVSATILSSTPSLSILQAALSDLIETHPLLSCHVEGDGEPERRIDLFQMVREGDPNPCTFVSGDGSVGWENVLNVINVSKKSDGMMDLEESWKESFERNLDDGSWCDVERGPLWKLEFHRLITDGKEEADENDPCAMIMVFNHAISDQSSANLMMDQLLHDMSSLELNQKQINNPAIPQGVPPSLESVILGPDQNFASINTDGMSLGTLKYVLDKAAEGFKSPVVVPDPLPDNDAGGKEDGGGLLGALTIITGRTAGGSTEDEGRERKSVVQFRTLDGEKVMERLIRVCRKKGVTVSHALSAAMVLTATDFIDNGSGGTDEEEEKSRNYKVLQSLDMRRFPHDDKLQKVTCDTVSCMAGSMDLMLGPLSDRSGQSIRQSSSSSDLFWSLARESAQQTEKFISSNGPMHAVRVFDFAMTISDMNNLVHLSAESKDTQGRAYGAGCTNVGVYERQLGVRRVNDDDDGGRSTLKIQHGRYKIKDIFYATSHARSGSLYQASCMTVDGNLQMTFHPASPIVSDETNRQFADAFVELLETIVRNEDTAGISASSRSLSSSTALKMSKDDDDDVGLFIATEVDQTKDDDEKDQKTTDDNKQVDISTQEDKQDPLHKILPPNTLPLLTTVIGLGTLATHLPAYAEFFTKLSTMKQMVPESEDFWAALNFWIFFAVGHPILQPVLWISDVLHGSPGPKVLGEELVPLSFLLGNALVIASVVISKEIRNSVNIGALFAFLAYVGSGLDGNVPGTLGDYNLQLDDDYNGQVVKGCPAYDDVRQKSMDDFNINKYQGKWYEQKFHDWTQFKEVYDTSLDIKLTEGGKGWKDDFAVKGPAPDAAKLSWDKSPVANGAHYFLFGRVDDNDPPGVLRESGFGVEFPNYIVDVKKDAETGEYTESIQFQCLERGGIRVFEGINFLSRAPQMTPAQLEAMHSRAEKAGMFPYGASPEQMHTVARRPLDAPEVDNNWQRMWKSLGVDRLLDLLTESIEDGER